MALLVWCLGIATIYPPCALIVTLEAHTYTEKYNISVMNPTVPQSLDLFNENDIFSTLGDGFEGEALYTVSRPVDGDAWEDVFRIFVYEYVKCHSYNRNSMLI
jgi:hypothetical protein